MAKKIKSITKIGIETSIEQVQLLINNQMPREIAEQIVENYTELIAVYASIDPADPAGAEYDIDLWELSSASFADTVCSPQQLIDLSKIWDV